MISSNENICNFKYLTEMVNGKSHLVLGIMDIFLVQVPEDLKCINDAVEIDDYPTIKSFAHTIKSSVSIMGITVLASVLCQMEELAKAAKNMSKIIELNKQLNLICMLAIKEIETEKKRILIT